jgi:hypothetical protein
MFYQGLCFANTLYTLHYSDFFLLGVTSLNLDSRLIRVGGQLLPGNVDGPEACPSALIKGKELGR